MIIIKQKTANHIMNADDLANIVAGHFVIFEMASAGAITLTVPQQSDLAIPDGAVWGARQTGDGTLTVIAADDMVITSTSGGLIAPAKNVMMTFEKRGSNDVILQNGAPPKGAWTPWIPSAVGLGSISTATGAYYIDGKTVNIYGAIVGTSSATVTFTIDNLPLPAAATQFDVCSTTSNTTGDIGVTRVQPGSSVLTLWPSGALDNWSTSGAKNARFTITYQAQ